MTTAIWWIRRDLRLIDNAALRAAAAYDVLPVFIHDPHLLERPYKNRISFLYSGLQSLQKDLKALGGTLCIRWGKPVEQLSRLMQESGAGVIFAEEDYTPYSHQRDREVGKALPLHLVSGLTVHPPQMVLKPDGSPYSVFTPFSRAWKSLPMPPLNTDDRPIHYFAYDLPSEEIPKGESLLDFPASENEANLRLEHFLSGPVFTYHDDRNVLALAGTSGLSPYFRFGMLSPRVAADRVMDVARSVPDSQAKQGCETWLNELIWREFYQSILYHHPHVAKMAFNPGLRNIRWRNDPNGLAAWQQGLTGYPVVDAAMRQLAATGWMHNRARMITASFLVKDLLIDWQLGEDWFFTKLLDGDLAANNGGWQWTAGVGTDAAPYFRIFSPVLQSAKFDPRGAYIRKWVPELAGVPDRFIHEPWRMTLLEQRSCGCIVGEHYPAPIVDHSAARQRTLDAYRDQTNTGKK